jgi:hypothetical protein
MRWRIVAGLDLLILVAGCAAVPAPDLNPPGPRSAAAALRRMGPDREVRLHHAGGTDVQGRLRFQTADAAGILTPAGMRVVSLAALDTVWVHRDAGRTAGRGLLAGVATGAALAILLMSADCRSCDDPGLGRALTPYVFALATSAGGLIGSIGGAMAPEWIRIFPAVRSPRPW